MFKVKSIDALPNPGGVLDVYAVDRIVYVDHSDDAKFLFHDKNKGWYWDFSYKYIPYDGKDTDRLIDAYLADPNPGIKNMEEK